MSGGSYSYLCYKDVTQDLRCVQLQLQYMSSDMRVDGFEDCADEFFRISQDLKMFDTMINKRMDRLRTLMHDWEWYRSDDYGRDQFGKSWEEFLEGKK